MERLHHTMDQSSLERSMFDSNVISGKKSAINILMLYKKYQFANRHLRLVKAFFQWRSFTTL